jgi:hypothetical protein
MNIFKFDDLLTKIVNINNYFANFYNNNEHKASCTVQINDFSLKFFFGFYDSFEIVETEKELCEFLEELGFSDSGIPIALHFFEFGEFPTEKANNPLPNALSFEDIFLAKQAEILRKKGLDYNGGAADSLALFKKVGADLNEIFLNPNILPETKVILINIAIKLERLKNLLLSGGVPNFESLQDTISDGANYHVFLAKAISENANLK